MTSKAVAALGPADLRDQRWLDERVADLRSGIDAAREIWANWYEGRQVGRLHPGMTPGQYIASLGMRLSLPESIVAAPDASVPTLAAMAGVSERTVQRARQQGVTSDTPSIRGADGKSYPRVVREVRAQVIETQPEAEPPPRQEPRPRASAGWAELQGVMKAVRELGRVDPGIAASVVPPRRRGTVARDLRSLGRVLGAIASRLEEEQK